MNFFDTHEKMTVNAWMQVNAMPLSAFLKSGSDKGKQQQQQQQQRSQQQQRHVDQERG